MLNMIYFSFFTFAHFDNDMYDPVQQITLPVTAYNWHSKVIEFFPAAIIRSLRLDEALGN